MKMTFIHLTLVAALLTAVSATATEDHWVGTWGCAPQLTERGNMPPPPGLTSNTLRQVVHVSIGGKRLRARFSNAFSTNATTLDAVHIALCPGATARGTIEPSTDKPLTFHGKPSVTMAPGEDAVWSDPLDFDLPPLTNLAITIHFGETSPNITGHPGSRTTFYIVPGDAVAFTNMTGAATNAHWYNITGVDVAADTAAKSIVTLGDSITDGRGSTTDGNNRWPDALANRLNANPPTAKVGVLNMGIGGNGIFGGLGPSAKARFKRDVLDQSSARWLIIFEGVNDIGGSRNPSVATNLIAAFQQFADDAHAHNFKVYGATITPFGKSFYDRGTHEASRETVNTWIRTNKLYDAVIDFDAAVRDPGAQTNLLPAYDTGDHLHLNPAGYKAMADAIDLKLFTQ